MNLSVGNNRRIPAFLGDYNGLFRTALQHEHWLDHANDNFLHVYNTGFKTGKSEGINEGIVIGAKDFLFNGRRQFYFGQNKVFAFDDVGEILGDEKTAPHINKVIKEQHEKDYSGKKNEYNENIAEIKKMFNESDKKNFEEDDVYTFGENPFDAIGKDKSKLVGDENLQKLSDDIYQKSLKLDNDKGIKTPKEIQEVITKRFDDINASSVMLNSEIETTREKLDSIRTNVMTTNKQKLTDKLTKLHFKKVKLDSDLKAITKLNQKINEYNVLQSGNKARKKAVLARKNIERSDILNDPDTSMATRKNMFREFRKGGVAIGLYDGFTLVNGDALHKIHNKNKKDGLLDASVVSYKNNDKFDPNIVVDYRTIKDNVDRNIDLILFPDFIKSNPMTPEGVMVLRKSFK